MTVTSEQTNVFTNTSWEREIAHERFGVRGHGVIQRCTSIGGTLYELDPGKTNFPYHTHHGMDEVIIVLAGTPTLRTPAGERQLAVGDLVECPAGPDGAHQLINNGDEAARVLVMSSKPEVDVVEYPDSGKISAGVGQWGSPTFKRWLLDASATREYFDGE